MTDNMAPSSHNTAAVIVDAGGIATIAGGKLGASMKRFLLLAAMLFAPVLCWAQNTVVTATVVDPSNLPYTFATGYAALFCPGNQQPTYNGFTVPRTFAISGFDGTGTFTQTVYDVSVIMPTGCGYQWHITWSNGVTTFITGTITSVTGASVNESTAISAYSVPLPTVPNPASLSGNNIWTGTQTFPEIDNILYVDGVTNTTITGAQGKAPCSNVSAPFGCWIIVPPVKIVPSTPSPGTVYTITTSGTVIQGSGTTAGTNNNSGTWIAPINDVNVFEIGGGIKPDAIFLRDMFLLGNGLGTSTSAGVYTAANEQADVFEIRNLAIQGFKWGFLSGASATDDACHISSSNFFYNYWGIYLSANASMPYCKITSNEISDNGGTGIYALAGTTFPGFRVSDTTLVRNAHSAAVVNPANIYLETSHNIISNDTLRDAGANTDDSSGDPGDGVLIKGSYNLVQGNQNYDNTMGCGFHFLTGAQFNVLGINLTTNNSTADLCFDSGANNNFAFGPFTSVSDSGATNFWTTYVAGTFTLHAQNSIIFQSQLRTKQFIADQGAACTNGELVLSGGWGTTASVSGAFGQGQTCSWLITSSGTGQGANPTITDSFTNSLPSANVLCTMEYVNGTGLAALSGAGLFIDYLTPSATAGVFQVAMTPAAGSTYKVARRCGP